MVTIQRRYYISIRFILIVWFVVISILPLALVTWYSIAKFETAVNSEQIQRLQSNAREIEVSFAAFNQQMLKNRDELVSNPHFTFHLMVGDHLALKDFLVQWLTQNSISQISAYNRDGRRLSFAEKEYYSSLKLEQPDNSTGLDQKVLDQFKNQSEYAYFRGVDRGIELIYISRVFNSSKKDIGFLEQKILLKKIFLDEIKEKLNTEIMLIDDQFRIANSTIANFESIEESLANPIQKAEPDKLHEASVNFVNYALIVTPIKWGNSNIRVVVGTIKRDSQAFLNKINYAFLGVIGLGIILLFITIVISTSVFLRPVNALLTAIEDFQHGDVPPTQVRVKNRTEIGLLMNAFNQMSMRVYRAREDLTKKVLELETANKNLKEAQAQLVQSAKMTSLGQLVAGVAHELNNPIGFIYSNMSHLKDYSEKLFNIISEIEKDPSKVSEIKESHDYAYIKTDLPRLIRSCEDGAQRTRDIVRGLRNFSRLEESQIKEVDLNESLDMTLELIKGETKNRIKIHRKYQTIPLVSCYASQINQVFMNILTNAVHAISGNGQIWITTQSLEKDGLPDKVQISVQDDGIGMDEKIVEKIFEPFFTTKDVGKGTGLGLSISYGIIQSHGGEIKVKSQRGLGTEFVITIPVSQPIKKAKVSI